MIDALFQHAEKPEALLVGAQESNVLSTLVASLGSDMVPFGANGDQHEDVDLMEKALGALKSVVERCGKDCLTAEQRQAVSEAVKSKDLGLTESEVRNLVAQLE